MLNTVSMISFTPDPKPQQGRQDYSFWSLRSLSKDIMLVGIGRTWMYPGLYWTLMTIFSQLTISLGPHVHTPQNQPLGPSSWMIISRKSSWALQISSLYNVDSICFLRHRASFSSMYCPILYINNLSAFLSPPLRSSKREGNMFFLGPWDLFIIFYISAVPYKATCHWEVWCSQWGNICYKWNHIPGRLKKLELNEG